jgi:hypothetical protein
MKLKREKTERDKRDHQLGKVAIEILNSGSNLISPTWNLNKDIKGINTLLSPFQSSG